MILVNLLGGPGAGKTTTMCGVMYKLKVAGVVSEIAPEYAKDLVWEGRQDTLTNQIYVTGKQLQRIERVNGEVDVVITDSPLITGCFYKPEWYPDEFDDFVVHVLKTRFHSMNYYINRVKPYVEKGRNQNESEAREVDRIVHNFLDKHDIPYRIVDGNENSVNEIVPEVISALRNGPPEWCRWSEPPNAKTGWPRVA